MTKKIEFEESTGNDFTDDIGLKNVEELQARGMVSFHVIEILKGNL